MPQQQFKGYSDGQKERIASKLGHTGGMDSFDSFLKSNPDAKAKFFKFKDAATRRYAQGGAVTPMFSQGGGTNEDGSTRYSWGPVLPPGERPIGKTDPRMVKGYTPPLAPKTPEGIDYNENSTLGDITVSQHLAPKLPTGTAVESTGTNVESNQLMDDKLGMVTGDTTATTTGAATTTADTPVTQGANTVGVDTSAPKVGAVLDNVDAATGTVGTKAQVDAAQQTTSAVSGLDAAQTTATQVEGAPTRTLEGGELVNPVADAQKAAQFTEQIQAAQADPSSKATVQGQLATLMTSFEDGKTPAWAAGAMRNVTAQMAARGIGSSSMAGQALIQAALETSLPIATADAQTFANFEMTNLNNKQQRAMLSAQQRATFMGQEFDQGFQSRVINATKISEVANMNFNATQQIALENAQLAGTVNLANLSNRQANVMAEAAALSQLDIANLNNRQQAQVNNAKSFLDMDMANLSNEQQTTMFKAQENVNALLTDTAAANAAKQFNATSENQTDQFFASLTSSVSQFNATQKNAQDKFNSGEATSVSKFNAELRNQREQFNANNSLVINQSNAQWRRTVATADTAAINRANEVNAKSLLDISNTAYNNLWQENRDEMDWAYKISEGENDRYNAIVRATISAEASIAVAGKSSDGDFWSSLGSLVGTVAGAYVKKNW